MRKPIVALSLSICLTPPITGAQTPQPPPDFYNDFDRAGFGFWKNPSPGWVVNTDGTLQGDVQFVSDGALPTAYIRRHTEISFVLSSVDTSLGTMDTLRRLDMSFSGENFLAPDANAVAEQPGHRNFYLAHCGQNGVTDVRAYNRIHYKDVYPHIDLWLYCGARGQKMAIVLKPGADPEDLRLVFNGQNEMDLDVFGNLKMLLEDKWIVLPEAVVYQYDSGNNILPLNWTAEYVPNNNTGQVGFTFDAYDPSLPLVLLIGPPPVGGDSEYPEETGLCWSTYIGGNGDTFIHESTTDVNNFYYIAGKTSSIITLFPGATGTSNAAVGMVSFTTQFDQQDQDIWTTYLGGLTADWCESHGLVCNENGTRVYVAGWTNSSDFSVFANGSAYYQPTNSSGTNGFVARFDPIDGSCEWSTYVSSSYGKVTGMAHIHNSVDSRIVLTGSTNGTLPVVQDPIPTAPFPYGGSGDAMLVMFNSNDRTCFATHIGGTESDYADEIRSLPTVSNSSVVIAGTTYSPSLPSVPCSGNTYCYGPTGSLNTFLMEFNFQGAMLWSTYLYTPTCSGVFWDNALAFDPVTKDVAIGTYGRTCGIDDVGPGYHGIDDEFVDIGAMFHRFSGIDRSLVWFSYIGCSDDSEAHIRAMAFDAEGNLYAGGNFKGTAPFVPSVGQYNQLLPYPNYQGGDFNWPADPFVMRFAPGNIHDWGTFIGGYGVGSFWENDGIYTMLGRNGELYVAGGHAKQTGFETSYFALDEADGIPYFSGDHIGGQQGFVASMCLELSIGIDDQVSEPRSQPRASFGPDGSLNIHGIDPGPHRIELVDGCGKLCLDQVQIAPSSDLRIPNRTLFAPGLYLLRLDGGISIKVCRP